MLILLIDRDHNTSKHIKEKSNLVKTITLFDKIKMLSLLILHHINKYILKLV